MDVRGLGPFVGRDHLLVVENEEAGGCCDEYEEGDGCLGWF